MLHILNKLCEKLVHIFFVGYDPFSIKFHSAAFDPETEDDTVPKKTKPAVLFCLQLTKHYNVDIKKYIDHHISSVNSAQM